MNMKALIIVGVVVIISLGGFFWYRSAQSEPTTTPTEESTDTTKEPTSTPTPKEAKKNAYSIEILNGSGIEGEAGRAQELLEGADYDVQSTDNADNYDYGETVIRAGRTVDEKWLEGLREELGTKYSVQSETETLNASDSDADVVVIIGNLDDNGDSMTPEEEPTPEEETTITPEPTEDITETPTP
ncbi:MAG: LytR C-terminal domain-containing protein [Candidatus Roizmanbacteria bacterium]|nr:LytR C-terminal domain-containing protein [Candidatus Roizmanbacteria bacterium]